jgi:hypothetical protein
VRRALLRIAWIFPLLTPACTSSKGSTDAGATDDGQEVSCAHDSRVDTYVANLTKTSSDGSLKVTLVSSDPAPPALENNTWIVKLADGSGAPMPNATLSYASLMPDHGHPGTLATITPQADGTLKLDNVNFFMPGVWRVTLSVAGPDGGAPPSVQFFFCIEG